LIVIEFYNLTVADIHFVFEKAKKGGYGKFYDRFDGTMVMEWFRNHFDERCVVFERRLKQRDLQYKNSRMNYEENLFQSIRRRNIEELRVISLKTNNKDNNL